MQHCGVTLALANGETVRGSPGVPLSAGVSSVMPSVTRCYVPDELPIDLRAKLIVCLIRLKQAKCLPPLMTVLYE